MKKTAKRKAAGDPFGPFHPAVRDWFVTSFPEPTSAQRLGWPAISSGESTLILAPTGSGKTLTAFLWCINRLMFSPLPEKKRRCRVIYVSPLKALAVDVERNLRAPIAGIARVASAVGTDFIEPEVWIRTGDTPQRERAAFLRQPADILITTPESLFLMVTSLTREVLRSVETIIIDEIHALVPTKRGSHLALTLERLEHFCEKPPQRIGLSATQRPLEEVARFLGGCHLDEGDSAPEGSPASDAILTNEGNLSVALSHSVEMTDEARLQFRPVTIVDTGERKRLQLRVEVPVEEMARVGETIEIASGPAAAGPSRSSIWPAMHPRLLGHIRAHRSTLIFVNSRRLAERLAAALNELAGETLVSAHHGSLAREQRIEIEDRLKSGKLPALIATSSLELGIDMGAIDLVIQIESPPSVASGMQRIGRAGHQAGAVSKGLIFPKFRGDLLACATITAAMLRGEIEPTRYPRNPLDVLAQHIVAMVAMDPWDVEELYQFIRTAAPYADLSRSVFEGVLDMLSGLYPSDEFAELRPRITWDRVKNRVTSREGAKSVAISNAGTIPDRGLYGVFLAGAEKGSGRVGELDEEMVFESRIGETFVLGASSWRIEDITFDKVIVSPAPGEPGKMPFWHGDTADRPLTFGQKIGALVREIRSSKRPAMLEKLEREHGLDPLAAENVVKYVDDQLEAVDAAPDDRTIVVERTRDELGSWRICVLSQLGGRVHAPWAMAATAKVREQLGLEVETMWSDDGFILRFPETEEPPTTESILPTSEEVEPLVLAQLPGSSMFAAKFRENASRALLLPKRRPGQRAPLWQQRKRAADLLGVASKFGSFPILLETYRECLRDIFDLPALQQIVRSIERREMRIVTVDSEQPSPFAASLLFHYVANYIYDGDAPLAERRAQALSIDQSQLRELLGDAEFRELLDLESIEAAERQLQQLEPDYRARSADSIHDMLLRLGDLSRHEITTRASIDVNEPLAQLDAVRRVILIRHGGEERYIAVEDAARYRDALGVPLPAGLPERLLAPSTNALTELIGRYARTHAPFTTEALRARWSIGAQLLEVSLRALESTGRILEGDFTPGVTHREWCDSEVLRLIRRRALARLRHEIEPVEAATFARLLTHWQTVARPRRGLDAVLDAVDLLQGYPLPASLLDSEIMASRLERYRPSDLDTLAAAGEIVWLGVEPVGEYDGRVALYLADSLPLLAREPRVEELSDLEEKILDVLRSRGASFFSDITMNLGGFPNEAVDALWSLVWKGVITNDTLQPLRRYVTASSRSKRNSVRVASSRFRSRRTAPPGSEGRWTVVEQLLRERPSSTARATAMAKTLLNRYGVVSRESAGAESLPGGFSAVYDILKAMEESGKARRGFFISGIAATQFALPAALDRLRSLRFESDEVEAIHLAATDPANPYGSLLKWPETERTLSRAIGAHVILVDGRLSTYISRGSRELTIFLSDDEPARSRQGRAIAGKLADLVHRGKRRAVLVASINGSPTSESPLAPHLVDAGFTPTAMGYHLRAATFDRKHAPVEESLELLEEEGDGELVDA